MNRSLLAIVLAALALGLGQGRVRADEPVPPPAAPTAGVADAAPSAAAPTLSPPADATPTAAATPTAPAPAERPLTALPLDKGLPVIVRAALAYVDVDSVDENDEAWTGTVDVRLVWEDPRLRFPAEEAPVGFKEFRGEAAVARLAELWSPDVALANLRGDPVFQTVGIRQFPDGTVELLQRTTGQFGITMNVERFPFDRQKLAVELVSRRENADKMSFDFRQDDLDFSHVDPTVEVQGWDLGLVDLERAPLGGWHGESYSRLRVALDVDRRSSETVPSLFIPLLASLLIPLLATWLNKMEDAEFQIEAFELTNIIIGGLFAVIALNFTINADRSILAHGGNTVAWLFGLNYLTLALSLGVNVSLFRFNAVRRFFGKYVQEQVFLFVSWALPTLVGATAVAFLLIARF